MIVAVSVWLSGLIIGICLMLWVVRTPADDPAGRHVAVRRRAARRIRDLELAAMEQLVDVAAGVAAAGSPPHGWPSDAHDEQLDVIDVDVRSRGSQRS